MAYEGVTEILNSYITSDDLKIATNRYNAAVSSNNCNASMRFEYALALTRSRYSVDQLRAIQLLEDLCVSGDNEAFRDYLYYLTIANIKLQVSWYLNSHNIRIIIYLLLFLRIMTGLLLA